MLFIFVAFLCFYTPSLAQSSVGDAQWGTVKEIQDNVNQNNPGSIAAINLWNPAQVYNTTLGNLSYKALSINNSRSREGAPLYRGPEVMQAPSMITGGTSTGYGISLVPGTGVVTANREGHVYMGAFSAPIKGISFTTIMKLLQSPTATTDGFSPENNKLYACFTLSGIRKNDPGKTVVLGRKYIQIWNQSGDNQGMQAPETISDSNNSDNYAGNTSPEGTGYMQVAYQGDDELRSVELDYQLKYDVTGFSDGDFNGEAYTTSLSFSCFAGGTVQNILHNPTVTDITESQLQALGASSLRMGALYLADISNRTDRAKEIMGQPMMTLLSTPQNNSYLLISVLRDRFLSPPSSDSKKGSDFAHTAMAHMACFSNPSQHFVDCPKSAHFYAAGPGQKSLGQNKNNPSPVSALDAHNKRMSLWVQPFTFLRTQGNVRANFSGALVGADYACSPQWTFGCALGWGHNMISEGKETDVNNVVNAYIPMIAPYALYQKECQNGTWSAAQNFLFSSAKIKGERRITEQSLQGMSINSTIPEDVFASNSYVGYTIHRPNHNFLKPYFVFSFVHDRLGAFSETLSTNASSSDLMGALRLFPSSHNTDYAVPEIGLQYGKKVTEINLGYAEYFITASSAFLYRPTQSYDMNYVQYPSPYSISIKSSTALYGSVSLGAKLATLSNWSMGLMGRVDMSRLDTIYRAMAYVKKSF